MLISMFTTLALAFAQASAACDWNLEAIPEAEVRDVIARTELDLRGLTVAFDEMRVALEEMRCWPALSPGQRSALVNRYRHQLTSTLAQVSMGNRTLAHEQTETLARDVKRTTSIAIDPRELYRDLREIAKRREVELTLGQFVANDAPSPETVWFEATLVRRRRDPFAKPADPRQIEMIKIALQYGSTRGSVRLLEIGDEPSVAGRVLAHLTQKPVDHARVGRLDQARGPYQVVFAFESLTNLNKPGLLRSYAAAERLFSLLAPGGTLVIVNHRGTKPYLSTGDAERAGFEVVRWADRRRIAGAWSELLPTSSRRPAMSRVFAFVLRKPAFDHARARGDILTLALPGRSR